MKLFKITSNNNLLLSWYIEVKEQKADLQGHWRAENDHQKKKEGKWYQKLWNLQWALRTAWHKEENEKKREERRRRRRRRVNEKWPKTMTVRWT